LVGLGTFGPQRILNHGTTAFNSNIKPRISCTIRLLSASERRSRVRPKEITFLITPLIYLNFTSLTSDPIIMAQDPRALLQKADKAAQGATGGFSLFGGRTEKWENAADLYVQAANAFRVQKQSE
jgi:hypothetical protein